jgi:hypothetical protein
MGYLLLVLIVLLIGAVALLALKPGRRGRTDDDVTRRDPAPPVEPDDPVPGSAPRRRRQGKT